MKKIDFTQVEESTGSFPRLVTGGYIVRITGVEDVSDKEYLSIVYDIASGDFKDFFSEEFYNGKEYLHRIIRSYKETALGMFKNFYRRVEDSNQGFVFDCDESKLVGKYVGIVLSEEEYYSNTGDLKTRLYVSDIRSTRQIQDGDFVVKELKKAQEPKGYQQAQQAKATVGTDGFMDIPDGIEEGLPFN